MAQPSINGCISIDNGSKYGYKLSIAVMYPSLTQLVVGRDGSGTFAFGRSLVGNMITHAVRLVIPSLEEQPCGYARPNLSDSQDQMLGHHRGQTSRLESRRSPSLCFGDAISRNVALDKYRVVVDPKLAQYEGLPQSGMEWPVANFASTSECRIRWLRRHAL